MTSKRIQRLVRIKKLVEDGHARELFDRQEGLRSAREREAITRSHLVQLDATAAQLQGSAADLRLVAEYEASLLSKVEAEGKVVLEREVHVEAGRERVTEAWRDRRLMETVQNRVVLSETDQRERGERKVLDAIALDAYASARRNG